MVAGLRGSSSGCRLPLCPQGRRLHRQLSYRYRRPHAQTTPEWKPHTERQHCSGDNTSFGGVITSTGITALSSRYQRRYIHRPSPTTTSPITAPLRKAMQNPHSMSYGAAFAVRAERIRSRLHAKKSGKAGEESACEESYRQPKSSALQAISHNQKKNHQSQKHPSHNLILLTEDGTWRLCSTGSGNLNHLRSSLTPLSSSDGGNTRANKVPRTEAAGTSQKSNWSIA